MSRELIRIHRSFQTTKMPWPLLCGIRRRFHRLSPWYGQIAHALRTLAPVAAKVLLLRAAPRLACVKPAASVHPEPGSNSSLYNLLIISQVGPCNFLIPLKESTLCSSDFNRVKIGTCLYLFFLFFQWTSTFFPKRAAKVCEFFESAKIFSKNFEVSFAYACSTMSIPLVSRTGLQR